MKRFLAVLFLFAAPAFACEPCAIYSAQQLRSGEISKLVLELGEEYTDYSGAEADGHAQDNFSVTSVNVGLHFSKRAAVQLHFPIVRHRETGGEDDAGFGDFAFLAQYSPLWHRKEDSLLIWGLAAGLKIPSGDTGALVEEDEHEAEMHEEDEGHAHLRHGGIDGENGRVLSVGSGSYDGIFGTALWYQTGRNFANASVQYDYRTEGDFDYQFGDDLIWRLKAGRLVMLDEAHSLGVALSVSGDHKQRDERAGEEVGGTRVSDLFVGPEVNFTVEKISGECGVDFAVSHDGDSGSSEPDWRLSCAIRAAIA